MSLYSEYTGTDAQKDTIINWLLNNPLTDEKSLGYLTEWAQQRVRSWGSKAGTFGFVFKQNKELPTLIKTFIFEVLRKIENSRYCINGMPVYWHDYNTNGDCKSDGAHFGFFLDINAKSYNCSRVHATPDEAILILISGFKGEHLNINQFLTTRRRRDGHYAFSSFFDEHLSHRDIGAKATLFRINL